MTEIKNIPGFSENAPKKITSADILKGGQLLKKLSLQAYKYADGHNTCHDAFSSLTVEVDEEIIAKELFDDMKGRIIDCVNDEFCFVCGFPIKEDKLMDLCRHLAKKMKESPQRLLRIGREK